ncbi:serine--tRNA ligase [Patescibacteria group bacterium]|nr:serine--tRNA ligase [Patescibacteria group bacterium]
MLDIRFIREHPNIVKEGCRKKQVKVDVDKLLKVDEKRRDYLKELESLRAEQNRQSYLISKAVDPTKRDERIALVSQMKADIRGYENYLKKIEPEYEKLLRQIPNLPLEDVPVGQDERDNVVIRKVGKKPKFSTRGGSALGRNFKPKNYLEIAENLDLIDIKRAAKVSGTRFAYLKKEVVLLEFALINLAFDVLAKEGFIPVIPPVLIKPNAMRGMGYIDTKQDLAERYFLEKDKLFLIGTSEQSIGPMHQDEVLEEKELTKRYVAFSVCFREEAGSYGKDTRGILRVHQFDKVEMFSFCRPEDSKKEHKFFLKMTEKLMQYLKIPYQVVQVCTGDLSRPSAATYDLESWMPSQNKYRETQSITNCTDFQARRLNIRYRNPKTKKLEFVHTLNGTAFAIGRTLIAIIENYQKKDGSVEIPKVLQKYLKFKEIKG